MCAYIHTFLQKELIYGETLHGPSYLHTSSMSVFCNFVETHSSNVMATNSVRKNCLWEFPFSSEGSFDCLKFHKYSFLFTFVRQNLTLRCLKYYAFIALCWWNLKRGEHRNKKTVNELRYLCKQPLKPWSAYSKYR